MKENLNWQALAEELTNLIGEATEETACEVKAEGKRLVIYPSKQNTDSFFHPEEVVDFVRCKKLSVYFCVDNNRVVCHIF